MASHTRDRESDSGQIFKENSKHEIELSMNIAEGKAMGIFQKCKEAIRWKLVFLWFIV